MHVYMHTKNMYTSCMPTICALCVSSHIHTTNTQDTYIRTCTCMHAYIEIMHADHTYIQACFHAAIQRNYRCKSYILTILIYIYIYYMYIHTYIHTAGAPEELAMVIEMCNDNNSASGRRDNIRIQFQDGRYAHTHVIFVRRYAHTWIFVRRYAHTCYLCM
jgi:hypothetical protein